MKNLLLKIVLAVPIIFVLVLLGFRGYEDYLAPVQPTSTPTSAPNDVDLHREVVSAEGKVVPLQQVQLSFSIPGMVEAVLVKEGDTVQEGQVISRLEGRQRMQAAITTAELELISAKQDLKSLYDNANLAKALSEQAVVDAREALDEAEKLVDSLNTTASEEDIEAAEAAVTLAEKSLERARRDLANLSKPNLEAKQAAAQLALYAAERQYYAALRRLNALQGGPSDKDLARANAAVSVAEAQLEKAEKDYEILKQGPDPDQVELAEARVANAEAQLAAAQTSLNDLELKAPFNGEIVSLDLEVGQVVNPGYPQVVLADLSGWKIETIDLPENDVALLTPGMNARITLPSFPDHEFKGVVRDISLFGEERRGSVTYMVSIDFDGEDYPVRWQMTAFVDISLP